MARFTSKHTVITFEDNAANSITVGPGQGDFTMGEEAYDNADWLEARDRGVHDGLVEGDDLVQDFSITIEVENQSMTSGAADRIMDFILNKTLSGSALTSIDSVGWAFKTTVTMTQASNSATKVLPKCTATVRFQEGKETSTFTITGKCYTKPTFT